MAYVHHWAQPKSFQTTEWYQLRRAAVRVIALCRTRLDIPICLTPDAPTEPPQCTADLIYFNAAGAEGGDDFQLDRDRPICGGWFHCDTARRPYDVAVTAVLALAQHLAPGVLAVRSDGTAGDWAPGLALARQVVPEVVLLAAVHRPEA